MTPVRRQTDTTRIARTNKALRSASASSRRTFLHSASVIGLAGLAGCLGLGSGEDDPCPSDDDALELCLTFDETDDGVVIDGAAGEIEGILLGETHFAETGRGSVIRLTDTGEDGIDFGDVLNLTDRLTVSTWFRPEQETSSWHTLVSNWRSNNGYWLGSDVGSGGMEWWINNTLIQADVGFTPGEWTHAAGTFDGTTNEMVLYVNGDEVARSADAPDAISPASDSLRIGHGPESAQFVGDIDTLRIWSQPQPHEDLCSEAEGSLDNGDCLAVEEATPSPDIGDDEAALMVIPDRSAGLQFYVTGIGDLTLYYFGEATPDLLDITHMVMERDGEIFVTINFNEQYYPIHWMWRDATISVRRREDEDFDPTDADHIVLQSCASLNTANISVQDIVDEVLDKLRSELGGEYAEAIDTVTDLAETLDVAQSAFSEVVDLARSGHEQRAHYTVLALFTSVASAASEFSGAINIPGIPMQSTVTQILDALGNLDEREFIGDDIGGPTVGALKCNGDTGIPGYPQCAEWFTAEDDIMGCLDCCIVTLQCFTDICMPVNMSVEEAKNHRLVY